MLSILALAIVAQVEPGPIDGFRANLASIQVSIDFRCDYYFSVPSRLRDSLRRFDPGPGPADTPAFVVEGRWEFDGTTEHYIVRETGGSRHDPESSGGMQVSSEVLHDGETLAYHYLDPGESILHVKSSTTEFPFPMLGPLTWKAPHRFDRDLETNYANAEVERMTRMRGDYRTEVEVYEKTDGSTRLRREVSYDPAVGYLPRYYRGIVFGIEEGRSNSSISELYLIDAQPYAAGGFVPTEWYLHSYNVKNFIEKYPNYDDTTVLEPDEPSTLLHFKAVHVEDRKGPVRLDQLAEVDRIFASGGTISLRNAELGPLTLADLKTRVGPKLKRSNQPVVPNIDYAEKYEFDDPPRRSPWLTYLFGGLAVVAVLTALVAWRRSAMFLLLIGCCIASTGCGQRPVARLTAGFTETRLVYDPSQHSLPMTLVVNNVGNQTLRVFKVDAGCSCRHIDPTQLPATLEPGNTLKLAVQMSGGNRFDPQSYIFTFDTDQGPLTAPVPLFALPSHHLSPRREIRCQFIFHSREKYELTPDFLIAHIIF